ncbi:histidine kinase dimerization/phosphoacceptor domain -containing protein [Spirosoma radiotolerans]|uniref:histidine kinase n=1 Tax=Spirosoma radiotolerans TaxID=1379870 RepID=A0A0E3ZVR2_9BACT|nr:histidine kinase dimerization/phosphoacceptor domain -containing protein [Spirosoma radiotolerans]AKD56248.1 histidine kinase [Spirosoma radiotolerans]
MEQTNPTTNRQGLLCLVKGKTYRLTFALLLCSLYAIGQNINRQMVNQLLVKLKISKADEKRVAVLLELGKYQIFKPGESKPDLDSGITYLQEARKLSDSLHFLSGRHEAESIVIIALMEGGNRSAGQTRFAKLIADCKRTGDKEAEANARIRVGIWLRNIDHNYQNVYANFKQALLLYQSVRNQEKEINALQEIAITHLYEGKIAVAETELLTVLRRYKVIRYPKLHYTYNLLANVGRVKGEFNKGLLFSLLCIESMNKTKDTVSAAPFYGDLAQMYMEVGNYKKGIEGYKKSLEKWKQERLPNFALYNAAGVIGQDLIKRKNPREALKLMTNLVREIPTNTFIQKACVAQNLAYCYDALKNHSLAEKYYLETLSWYAKNNMNSEASQQAQKEIGAFYLQHLEFSKAASHLRAALLFSPQENSLSTLKDIHFLLYKVDSATGNYISAITHFRLHKALNDSIFNEAKSKQIASLQIQYDTQKKEHDIALLTKQSKLQQSELKQEKTTRNAIIAGSLLLVCLLGVSYNRYQFKQHSNRLLQAQQEEINQKNQSLSQLVDEKEWMLREIHHRVKNNLQVITSMLNAQSGFLHDSTALTAVRESQNRVHAMAIIHQKLYQSDNLSQVNMQEYIHEIVDHLIESFDPQVHVQEKLDVANIQLDVTLATPLGLIINEAVTNSLKYAFPNQQTGSLVVGLKPIDSQSYLLTIVDDGVGLPAGFTIERSHTLGLTMIQGLSKQIGGILSIRQDGGVQISLQFNLTKKPATAPLLAV